MTSNETKRSWLQSARLRTIPLSAWLALAVSVAATGFGWHRSSRQVAGQKHERFRQEVAGTVSKLRERLLLSESVVEGARGLYAASKSVERGEWRVYGQGLFAETEYPGIRALLSISFVPHANLESFLKTTRTDEAPDFAVMPAGEREDYCPIKFIQSRGSGTQLTSQDVGLMPALRVSLMAARDSATSTLTRPLRLTVSENDPPEVLLILAVYRNGAPKETVAERRAALEGWVAALMPVSDLAAGLASTGGTGMDFQIYDDKAPQPLLYDTRPASRAVNADRDPTPEQTAAVAIGDRNWRIAFHSGSHAASVAEQAFPTLVLVSGGLCSLLFFYLFWSLSATQASARRAKEMTHTLRERDRQLHLALQSARMGVWEWIAQTDQVAWSDELSPIFGLPPGQHPPTRAAFLQLVAASDRARVNECIRLALENHQPFRQVFEITWPDGSTHWIDSSGSVQRDAASGQVKLVGVAMDITARKESEKTLEVLNRQLLDTSRRAGMADVASSVLHNVGNVLNSVNVSSTQIATTLRRSSVTAVGRVAGLLRQHEADLADYLTRDPKGRQIPAFFGKLAGVLEKERDTSLAEMESLTSSIDHIKQIISTQQGIARSGGVLEPLVLPELFDQALAINLASLDRHGIEVIRDFAELPPLVTDRHQVLQVLVNLISNAKYAMLATDNPTKRLTLRALPDPTQPEFLLLQVSDTGEGIKAEHLTRIFSQGFTTKKDGHGFGLHSAALAAKTMGGQLEVHSDGEGRGAIFTLRLPTRIENLQSAKRACA